MYSALDTMCSKAKVYITLATQINIILKKGRNLKTHKQKMSKLLYSYDYLREPQQEHINNISSGIKMFVLQYIYL